MRPMVERKRRLGRRKTRKRGFSKRGFSMMELLIVVTITTIGFVALLNLQVSSIQGLAYPTRLTEAVNLADHFLGTLQMEAMEWTPEGTRPWNSPNLRYLPTLQDPAPSWRIAWRDAHEFPDGSVPHKFVNQNGSIIEYDTGLQAEFPAQDNARFCVHYRLSWALPNERVMRAEVRVLWLRKSAAWDDWKDCPLGMEMRRDAVESVTVTGQVMMTQ